MPKVNSSLKPIVLSDEERDLIWLALCYRQNIIETGNPILSSQDISDGHEGKINPLDIEQMKLLIKIDELKKRIR